MARLVRLLKSFSLIDLLKGMWVTLKLHPAAGLHLSVPGVTAANGTSLPGRVAAPGRAGHLTASQA